MKHLLNLFLILHLVCKPAIPLLDYAVNYDYISKVLCINQSRPELHCNGKCYLGKELAKSSQENSASSSKTKQLTQKVIDFYIPVTITAISQIYKKHYSKINISHQKDYTYLFLKNIFRPPIFNIFKL
ncbi:MAG: hypothetical protein DI529_08775 [Chryseobacterium sp.]|nr:MAG: hypothetical protein DI529_08775 [Chryseobacterium sp.]